jgi:hypothetical protein
MSSYPHVILTTIPGPFMLLGLTENCVIFAFDSLFNVSNKFSTLKQRIDHLDATHRVDTGKNCATSEILPYYSESLGEGKEQNCIIVDVSWRSESYV